MIPNELQIASSGVPFTLHAAEAAGGTRTPFKSDPIRDLISLMPNDSYQLIGKDQMEPSILLRRLRRWRPEDADGAKPLVHAVLDEYERNGWRRDRFKWDTSVYPLFYFITKAQDMPTKAVYERVFDLAGHPSDEIEEPSLQKILGPVADAEVDLLIESAHYFIFIEAKKPDKKARFSRNKEECGATHQLIRQFVQGRLLAGQINKEFMLATLTHDEGPIRVELSERDKRLLEVVGQSGQEFPDVPNFSWDLLSLEIG